MENYLVGGCSFACVPIALFQLLVVHELRFSFFFRLFFCFIYLLLRYNHASCPQAQVFYLFCTVCFINELLWFWLCLISVLIEIVSIGFQERVIKVSSIVFVGKSLVSSFFHLWLYPTTSVHKLSWITQSFLYTVFKNTLIRKTLSPDFDILFRPRESFSPICWHSRPQSIKIPTTICWLETHKDCRE